MKQIGSFRLGLTFAGCFLGAGYVSGQELWQFFGMFGLSAPFGLLLAIFLLFSFGVLLLFLAKESKETRMDRIVIFWENPWLRQVVGVLAGAFLFGVAMIMAAGCGALFAQLNILPSWLGILLFCAFLALITTRGLRGMVTAFSYLVPLLIVATAAFCLVALLHFGPPATLAVKESSNPLLGNWILAAGVYVSYNLFGSIGILTPLGSLLAKEKRIWRGVGLGACFLLLIAASILTALFSFPIATAAELPMLELAKTLQPNLAYAYGLLLFCGMFGTALSCLVALLTYIAQKHVCLGRHVKNSSWIAGLFLAAGAQAGFGKLISILYPVFGYIGVAALLCVLAHAVRLYRAGKTRNNTKKPR